MSKVFAGTAMLAVLAGIYFIGRAIVALVRKEPLGVFVKRIFIAATVVVVASVGSHLAQTPEERAAIQAKREAEAQTDTDKRIAEVEKAPEPVDPPKQPTPEELAEQQRLAEEKRLADEQAAKEKAEVQKAVAAQRQQDEMIQELKTGWNVETTDTSQDYTNARKAASLVVKYPNHIHEAPANWIDPAVAMKKPWDYYGQVVNLTGTIYSIEQLPPGNPAYKFFGGDCYEAMLATDDVAISMIIVGDSNNVSEYMPINVKGYIFGHAALVNKMGGSSKGLAFVGFAE